MPEEYNKVATDFKEANSIQIPHELYELLDKNIRLSFDGTKSVFSITKDELKKLNITINKIDTLLLIIVNKYSEFGWTMLVENYLDSQRNDNAIWFKCSEKKILV